MPELRSAVDISVKHRKLIEQLQEMDILGFKTAEASTIFLFAMALGLEKPRSLDKKDAYFRTSYISKAKDKALFECVVLGDPTEENSINKYPDLESCLSLCEECAEAGFQELQSIVDAADWDKELIEERFASRLDLYYNQNVDNDI